MEIVLDKEFVKDTKSGDVFVVTLEPEVLIDELIRECEYVKEKLEEETEENISACIKERDWSNIKNHTQHYFNRRDELRETMRCIIKVGEFMEQYMQ